MVGEPPAVRVVVWCTPGARRRRRHQIKTCSFLYPLSPGFLYVLDYHLLAGVALTRLTSLTPPYQPLRHLLYHTAIMGEQLKFRGQLVAHEDWVTSIAATSEVRSKYACDEIASPR